MVRVRGGLWGRAHSRASRASRARRLCLAVTGVAAVGLLVGWVMAPAGLAVGATADAAAPRLSISAILQEAQLSALPNPVSSGNRFGYSVAVSGDTAVVGCPNYASSTGAAFVFVRSGRTWTQVNMLTAVDGAPGEHFGTSVAIDADTLAVGCPNSDTPGGAVYVFTRAGSSWSEQKLYLSEATAAVEFGRAVDVQGNQVLVGATCETPTGADGLPVANAGAAYVFTRMGSAWGLSAQLRPDQPVANEYAGCSVALSGGTALLGAVGSAYVFVDGAGGWTQQGRLLGAATRTADQFGTAVALSGDTALVGAYQYDGGASDSGWAYVFVRNGTAWTVQGGLRPPTISPGEWFGISVAISGDTAVVGASCDDSTASNAGAVYAFRRTAGTWQPSVTLTSIDAHSMDQLGFSVALSGSTVIAGAVAGKIGQSSTTPGTASVFLLDGDPPTAHATVSPVPNPNGWNRGDVTLTLGASDAYAGLNSILFRPSVTSGWMQYVAPVLIQGQGQFTYEFYSTDVVGNSEIAKSVTVRIDSLKPKTKAYAAAATKGRKVRLSFLVSDGLQSCGKADVVLRIYRGKHLTKTLKVAAVATNAKKSLSWRCTLARGTYTVKVHATDVAGNKQSKIGSAALTVR
jgi:hypothetical protein